MKMLQHLLCCITMKSAFGLPPVEELHSVPFATENGVIDYYDTVVDSLTQKGSRAWRFDAARPIETAAVGHDGTFYIGTKNGSFYALTTDGHVKWEFVANCSYAPGQLCFAPDGIHFGSNGNIFLRTAAGNLSVLSPAGELIWSANVAPFVEELRPQTCVSSLLGKSTSQDLVFVRGYGGPGISALSKSDGKVRWSVADGCLDAVAADGSLLVMSGRDACDFWYCQGIAKYSAEGRLLWNYSLPRYAIPVGVLPGADGTVYVKVGGNEVSHGSIPGLWALSSAGEFKWNITAEVSLPSEQNDKGDILLTHSNGIGKGVVAIVHSNGSHSPLHEFDYGCDPRIYCDLPRPILGPDGLIYCSRTKLCRPGSTESFGDILVLQPNGNEKFTFQSDSEPVFGSDGSIYIKRVDGRDMVHMVGTISVVEVVAGIGSDKWEYVLRRPVGCEQEVEGRECFKGFCRVPEENWSPPPPACSKQNSKYCCYEAKEHVPSGWSISECAALCTNTSTCAAFDFGPQSKECCLFADPGPSSHITGAADNKTIRGCWVASSIEPEFAHILV